MDNGQKDAIPESVQEAREVGLHYSSDQKAGIQRHNSRNALRYRDPGGKTVKDPETLARIKRLAIPPAWTDVWICASPHGHLQATGRDARGRKQYRYHERWQQHRGETKFHRMMKFARSLPAIRRQLKLDLGRAGMPKEKVLATVVRLLEISLIRVGNDEYARENHSYGLTTLRNHHVRVSRTRIQFRFRGKSGIRHEISVHDPNLARIVRRCQDMPGQELFTYEGEDEQIHHVTSQDINDYVRAIAQEDFTAKDFRTWAGTTLAAVALSTLAPITHETQAKKNIKAAVEAVAKVLGNTPTVCRNCYIHPAIVEAYLSGTVLKASKPRAASEFAAKITAKLSPDESAALQLLKSWLRVHNKTSRTAKRRGSAAKSRK